MANNFNTNPIRIDGTMAGSYLTQTISGLVPSAGLERPLKVIKITFENPTAGGTITVQDGGGTNVIFEKALATAGATVPPAPDSDFVGTLLWRNFQVTAFPAGAVMWIYRR